MSCTDCRDFIDNSCPDRTTTNCVTSVADPVEELDICLNDSLTWVINKITAKIKDLLKGRGIVFEDEDLDLSDCEYLETLLDSDEKSLINIINIYKQAICELKAGVDANAANLISFTNISLYTLGCLDPNDPCGDPLTFKSLIQAIITKVCALQTQLDGIATSILAIIEEGVGNFLLSGAVTSCGGNGYSVSGVGPTAVIKFEALVPPYSPILYTGSPAYFDGFGVGLPNTPYCGWYLCNGSNGTPNSSTLPQNLAGNLTYIIRFT